MGDWFLDPDPREWRLHLGDVYINGCSLYEAKSLEDVAHPTLREDAYAAPWTGRREKLFRPEDSLRQWFAQVGEKETVLYANFGDVDPNGELVEINVRKCCFYPDHSGCGYITVRGFEMAQAACPWAPPTGDQPGMVGPHWSKGWIIEKNILHDAKCSAVSIGKESSTGDNLFTRYHRKPGYQHQMESVFLAKQIGWDRETVGSHIIRNNVIYDCGQNGIVGHLGCVFSQIYGNEIYRIAVKHEYFGYEIAGIKLHAAIDVQITGNRIHHCSLGTWLDWQAQGTRISKNVYYENDRDLMVEVTHGPYLVDQNVFASKYNFDNVAQGGAYVHNLCLGSMRHVPVLNRSTPYHFPHTTDVAGCTLVYGGDDRFYQNIFVGGGKILAEDSAYGTVDYDGSPVSLEEYIQRFLALGNGDVEQYEMVRQPAYIDGNVYLAGAEAFDREEEKLVSREDPAAALTQEEDGLYLTLTLPAGLEQLRTRPIDGSVLGLVRIVEAAYENPDGSPVSLDTDLLGNPRSARPTPGPIEGLKPGVNRVKIW